MRYIIVSLIFIILMSGMSAFGQEDNQEYPLVIPPMPDCEDFATVEPEVTIGGNTNISLGGLDWYQVYIDQQTGSPLLKLHGEQMLGDKLELEGCFVDESEFWLFGSKGTTDVLFIGVAIKPEFSEPSFGGLWYGWSGKYDPEEKPDEKGFFFLLF